MKDEGVKYKGVAHGEFTDTDTAFTTALEIIKEKNLIPREKIYVWKQRYMEDKLSSKKVGEILELAGFKKVVEEKWMSIRIPSLRR